MAQVIVRELDDHAVASLERALRDHSLEKELRDILTRVAELSPAEKAALADSIAALQKRPLEDGSVDLIRADRYSR